jgi:predicted porin
MFKKTLAAVAVGMVAFGAQAAEFTAADGTAFQVNLDAQAEVLNTKATLGSSTTFNGAGQIQLKATRKVNDDLSAFGQVEVDFDSVVDNAAALSDDTKIGLSSKTFGSITFGQYDSYMEDNIAEALGYFNPAVADVKVSEASIGGRGRQMQYMTKFGDFTGVLAVSSSNALSATGEISWGNSFVLGYQSGPLKAFVGTSTRPSHVSNTFALDTTKSNTGASIYYTFGSTTVSALSVTTTTTANVDTFRNGLAVYHVMGDFDMAAAFQSKIVSGTATQEYTLHGGYTVTKGTKFYVGVLGLGATNGVGDLIALGFTTSF